MKRAIALSVVAVLLIAIVVATLFITNNALTNEKKPFYVGVTFGGDNSADAKLLIDRVKNCTNLFVLQSGSLMSNLNATEEICDYAVNSGLNIILSYSTNGLGSTFDSILNISQARWGGQFLGIYYNDEPGGKMLDSQTLLHDTATGESIYKNQDRSIQFGTSNESTVFTYTYSPSGEITITTSPKIITGLSWGSSLIVIDANGTTIPLSNAQPATTTIYFPNGTICYATNRTLTYQPNGIVQDENGALVNDQGNISQFESYQNLLNSCPIQTYTDAATYYVNTQKAVLSEIRNQSSSRLFTSDYALYWWDYQGGYDTVFAELGWNNTVAQEIGLVRGAANLQDKSWGTIITWKYTQAPYLTGGDEMFEQMRTSYECGAEYVIVFNYAAKMTGPYGTLQDEHFQALERFWKNVVQNSSVVHGGVRADAALVLPRSYGWGMRNPQDNIWGLWSANGTSQQIWTQLQSKLQQYGSKLDIVYDDAANPLTGKYGQIYYWNQTVS